MNAFISAAVSHDLAERLGKPVRNRIPLPESSSFSTIPARHQTHYGGSNGLLRFREEGIDYLTQAPRDSRAWRWRDIETLASPDPYTFRVQGYRETFSFELKEPMPPELLNRLWDKVYAGDPLWRVRRAQLSPTRTTRQDPKVIRTVWPARHSS
jgi:hypothetical protein